MTGSLWQQRGSRLSAWQGAEREVQARVPNVRELTGVPRVSHPASPHGCGMCLALSAGHLPMSGDQGPGQDIPEAPLPVVAVAGGVLTPGADCCSLAPQLPCSSGDSPLEGRWGLQGVEGHWGLACNQPGFP